MEDKFTVQIPVKLRKPFKIMAAVDGGTIQSVVADILIDELFEQGGDVSKIVVR